MINKEIIDEAFKFYNIDESYKGKCYQCFKEINEDINYRKAFNKIYELLYLGEFPEIKELWNIKDINELFVDDINSFVTNVMILCGYKYHKKNKDIYKLNEEQVTIHKKRVKECFENDLINRKYESVRISQMLWAVYFIRIRIIEIGRLQYEYQEDLSNTSIIKIHIPRDGRLDIEEVKKSLAESKKILKQIYGLKDLEYRCDSWLLSNQINKLLDNNSNTKQFYNLFDVKEGENCIDDILNFVYEIDKCEHFEQLTENTSLQAKIKDKLLNGEEFRLGLGILIQN